ncbi:hemolysin III family protein [Spongiibacter taiwanensis]|uniref:PAQR family membrane homeostasis protein TrhA n=1 Tax=Spongiibacter taiwanensis TaxID=1748242 RepID=UPI0020352479|nr:hemolysin III family protein [Spongiibacter taiwanensis]USA44113.1 hemolysin III family protein [Spongiibacter taiwanensis]
MYKGERLNSLTHLLGAIAAIIGGVALVIPALTEGDVWKGVSFAVYSASLFLLYLFSTLYHSTRGPRKALFRQLDHLAIYLLIAGTYTPFLLVSLRGSLGWWMFGTIWGLAAVGMIVESFPKSHRRLWAIIIYLLMGWLSLVLIKPLIAALPEGGFTLLLAGGLAYTFGIIFYVLDKKVRHFHGIWHLMVLLGSVCHFFTVYLYVA